MIVERSSEADLSSRLASTSPAPTQAGFFPAGLDVRPALKVRGRYRPAGTPGGYDQTMSCCPSALARSTTQLTCLNGGGRTKVPAP